jgi:hypothetical protein
MCSLNAVNGKPGTRNENTPQYCARRFSARDAVSSSFSKERKRPFAMTGSGQTNPEKQHLRLRRLCCFGPATTACADDWLINEVARKDWGFEGYVTTDWWVYMCFVIAVCVLR